MKNAVIVGGSNGIGLAIARVFIARGYHAVIVDRQAPEGLDMTQASYHACDLRDMDKGLFETLAADPATEALMITAGFGSCVFY